MHKHMSIRAGFQDARNIAFGRVDKTWIKSDEEMWRFQVNPGQEDKQMLIVLWYAQEKLHVRHNDRSSTGTQNQQNVRQTPFDHNIISESKWQAPH